MNKYIIRFEIEANINGNNEFRAGIGVLCNISSKKLKAIITFNHSLNLEFLNDGK